MFPVKGKIIFLSKMIHHQIICHLIKTVMLARANLATTIKGNHKLLGPIRLLRIFVELLFDHFSSHGLQAKITAAARM